MTSPFDALAYGYDDLWTNTPKGRRQRDSVWRELDQVFQSGHHVLDLGCGTGEDALHLGSRGVLVQAIDASARMVEVAAGRGVPARRLAIEQLSELQETYDGALSNFGAFNCVPDPQTAARELGRLIRSGGALVLCMMSRICWPEVAGGILRFRWCEATRRLGGRARWRDLEVRYPTRHQMKLALAPWFVLQSARSVAGGDHWLSVWRRSP